MTRTLRPLAALVWRLPDLFVRSALWLRSAGRYHIRTVGAAHWPAQGAAILAADAASFAGCMHVLSATDRHVRFLLVEEGEQHFPPAPLLRAA